MQRIIRLETTAYGHPEPGAVRKTPSFRTRNKTSNIPYGVNVVMQNRHPMR